MADVNVKNINEQPIASASYYVGVDATGKAIRVVPSTGAVEEVVGLTGVITQAELRTALGLGGAAYLATGTTGSTVAIGNHTHTPVSLGVEPAITAGTTSQYYRGDKTWVAFPNIQVPVQYKDEGSNLGASGAITSINFTGPAVTAAVAGTSLTVDVSVNTTNVPEGTNLYFTNARASAAAPVQSVAGLTGSPSSSQVKDALGILNADAVSVCDFGVKGDGSDETTLLQNALNSGAKWLSLSGKTVTAGPVTLPSGVCLVGDGGTLKAKSGVYYQIYIPNGSANSTIDNVTFDATGLITAGSPTGDSACISSGTTTGSMSGLRLTNNRFLNIPTGLGQRIHSVQLHYGEAHVEGNFTPQCGGDIYNFNSGYFIVTGNTAKNSGDGGIAFNNQARGCIVGNYIYKCDIGVGAGPAGTDANPDNTLLISSNEIVACGNGIGMGWFGYAGKKGPRNVKIVGNTVAKCKRTGIRYDGDSSNWSGYITIMGNTINDCGSTDYDGASGVGQGIYIGACKYTLISGNTLHDNAGTDIVVGANENVQVIGNALNAGVYAEAGGSWADFSSSHGLIANNTASGRRLFIQNSTGARVIGNTLTLGLQTANQGAVVVDASAVDVTISENNFATCGNAVYLVNLAGWFSHDVLDSNKFFNCTNKVVNSPLPRQGDMYVECEYGGVVGGSGYFDVAHGTANNGGYVMSGAAFYKDTGGASIPMVLSYVDGGTARFSTAAGNAGKTCRAWLRFNKNAIAW